MGKAAQVEAVERLVHESVRKVDAIAPEAMRKLLPALQQARDELRADLQRWLENVPDGADRFTAYQRTQALRALEATFDRIKELQPSMAGALNLGRAETGALAVSNLEHEVQRLSAIFGGGVPHLPQLDTAAVVAEGKKLLWTRHQRSAARYASGIGEDIKHRMAVSLAKGDTFEQAVQRLRGSADFRLAIQASDPAAAAHGVSDAMFNRWRHWGDRLVRTENMNAYNTQHDVAIEHVNENRSEDDDEYLRRWDATADKVACPRCRELDRTLATIKGDFAGGVHSPPLHPYCRCVVLAWLERWGDYKGEAPSKGDDGKDLAPAPTRISGPKPKPEPEQSQQGSKPEEPPRERKNQKRVEAAKKAAEARHERRREIHSTVRDALPPELQVAWDKEGHKFMREEAARIRDVKDNVNAAAKLSEAFAEQYGSGEQTIHGNEGDRSHKRAEIVAQHAEQWADEQERKYYEQEQRRYEEEQRSGRAKPHAADEDEWLTPPPKNHDDEDPPF